MRKILYSLDIKTDNALIFRKDGKLRLVLINLGETKFKVSHVHYHVNPLKYDAFLNYDIQVAPDCISEAVATNQ